jgi:hypothetical protein
MFEFKRVFFWSPAAETARVPGQRGERGWALVAVNRVWFYFKRVVA